ncbi:hypothetical protein SAMN05519103_04011 [Rhizobiales bacterium GAS113]|nr:hypothetical protein SAMN05519103_04011 [Rhizobiales bacterium GAS113]
MLNHLDIMATTTLASFTLKMSPELKEAAKALTKTHFDEPSFKEDGFFNMIMLGTVNDAILYLMRNGLRETLVHIERKMAEVTEQHSTFQELVTFFMQNAEVKSATSASFGEGSRARKYLDEMTEVEAEDENDDHVAEVNRAEAVEYCADTQLRLSKLVEAKGAIQKALVPGRR